MEKNMHHSPVVSPQTNRTFSQPDNDAALHFVNRAPNWIGEMTVENFSLMVSQLCPAKVDYREELIALAL